jgi:hypothetical protein
MLMTGSAPPLVPYGADQTIYLVVDDVGAHGETEIEQADLDTLISDLLAGRFSAPMRVKAFNTLEHWTEDVSNEIADEIQARCDIEGTPVPEHLIDFVAAHAGNARQLAACA